MISSLASASSATAPLPTTTTSTPPSTASSSGGAGITSSGGTDTTSSTTCSTFDRDADAAADPRRSHSSSCSSSSFSPPTHDPPHPLAKRPPPPQLAPVRRKPVPFSPDAARLTDCGAPAVASSVVPDPPGPGPEAALVDGPDRTSYVRTLPPDTTTVPSAAVRPERANAGGPGGVAAFHLRLASEPLVSFAQPAPRQHKHSATMSLHAPLQPPRPPTTTKTTTTTTTRPPPLKVSSDSVDLSANSHSDHKSAPKTPGSKITSFFGWKNAAASPGAESTSTEISESGVSPLPSPMNPAHAPPASATKSAHSDGPSMLSRSQTAGSDSEALSRVADMEAELRELSSELAGSIRREMELEDMIERLQMEANVAPDPNRRTSDYFSDSGNGSVKYAASDAGSGKAEDVEKLKRNFEQQRGQLKVELSQKWQDERSRRQTAESHVQILEGQVSQFRREKVDTSNLDSKTKELESTLSDTRRRLAQERETKDNYEDLLTAMKVDLERNKTEKDQLEAEVRSLRQPSKGSRFDSIAEEEDPSAMRNAGGLSRSSSARVPRSGLSRSGSQSRPSSMIVKDRDFQGSLADTVKDTETQRDALHRTVKSLLDRQDRDARQNEKRVKMLELELGRARQFRSPRKRGYEREVTGLRDEVSVLRRRADDALDQKWQSEKGLSGLKMDLDRAKQETSSLRMLLQEQQSTTLAHKRTPSTQDQFSDFQTAAASLETAYKEFQAGPHGDHSTGLRQNANLADEVRQRVTMNSTLKDRLTKAIDQGERDQQLSVTQINEMQARLKPLEDKLVLAQQNSEEEVAKHEQEVNSLKESHNAQLLRLKNGERSSGLRAPILPNSPFSGERLPRLSRTTFGKAMTLDEAVQTRELEAEVKNLEKALRGADLEMGEVVSRMNKAQMEVADLQSDRDEALRETRRLQSEILAARQ